MNFHMTEYLVFKFIFCFACFSVVNPTMLNLPKGLTSCLPLVVVGVGEGLDKTCHGPMIFSV